MMPIKDDRSQIILNRVNVILTELGYSKITPIRLSWEAYDSAFVPSQGLYQNSYQGLTKVYASGKVSMVKWALKPCQVTHHSNLDAEIQHIKQLNQQIGWERVILDYQLLQKTSVFIKKQCWEFQAVLMPYFPMGSIKDYLKDHKLSDQNKLKLAIALTECVQQVHQTGWVHGDIKPSNFLILSNCIESFQNSIYLNDWGCAHPQHSINEGRQPNNIRSTKNLLIKGTPAYLAPECWHEQPTTIQSDLYALGVVLFELFTGAKPYEILQPLQQRNKSAIGHNDTELISTNEWARLHCQQPIPLLPERLIRLQPVIDMLLAKRVDNRVKMTQTVVKSLQVLTKNGEYGLY